MKFEKNPDRIDRVWREVEGRVSRVWKVNRALGTPPDAVTS